MYDEHHRSMNIGPPLPKTPSVEVYDIVRLLLRAGTDVDLVDEVGVLSTEMRDVLLDLDRYAQGGHSALHCAAARGLTETARLLIEHGADVDARDRVILIITIRIIALLLKAQRYVK